MLQPPKTELPINTVECIGIIVIIVVLVISIIMCCYVCIINRKTEEIYSQAISMLERQANNQGMPTARNDEHLATENEIEFALINSLDILRHY
ncbi:hypothetical protein NEIRO03_2516 [Nematocida sp. AWRm78]|nr:hypothetical protein NEIRO03_2516 [Nematocida sp. AWRm78]